MSNYEAIVTQESQSEFYPSTYSLWQFSDLQFEVLITVNTYVLDSFSSLMDAKNQNWAKGIFSFKIDGSTAVHRKTGAINYCGQRKCIESVSFWFFFFFYCSNLIWPPSMFSRPYLTVMFAIFAVVVTPSCP